MLLSQTTEPFCAIDDNESIIEMFKDAGFDAFDFSFVPLNLFPNHDFLINHRDFISRARKLRNYIDKLGIVCNQAHAPFPIVYVDDKKRSDERFKQIVRSIKCASILGAKVIVVHPWNYWTPKENARFYSRLIPTLRKYPIKIGVENMWCWDKETDRACFASCSTLEDYLANMELLDPKYFVVNLDIGHCEMMEPNYSLTLIRGLNSRIEALHIHDNDQWHDLHAVPFTKNIDFNLVINGLKEIQYKGDLTLEVISRNNRPISEFKKELEEIYLAGDKLRSIFNHDS